jgi:hypothetical protein
VHDGEYTLPVFEPHTRPGAALTGRRIVYLDSSAWIGLIERQPELAELCARAAEQGTVLFPLSHPTISELIEQPLKGPRMLIAEWMDRLSCGVSLRPAESIRLMEADRAFLLLLGQPAVSPERSSVLSWIGEYLGTMQVNFHASWSRADAHRFIDHVREHGAMRSVRWLVEHGPVEKMQRAHAESKQRYVERLSASIARGAGAVSHLTGRRRKQRLLLEERKWATDKVLSPRFTDTLLQLYGVEKLASAVAHISSKLGEGSEKRFAQLMNVAPSLDLMCEIMAERTGNSGRRVRPQDFHDVQHALVGATYADWFVTGDRHLLDLLSRRCSTPARRGCKVVQSIEQVVDLQTS